MITPLFIRDREIDLGAAVVGLERECTCQFGNCLCILAELHEHGAQRTMPLGYVGCKLDDFLKLLSGGREITTLFRGIAGVEGCIGRSKPLLPAVNCRETCRKGTEDKKSAGESVHPSVAQKSHNCRLLGRFKMRCAGRLNVFRGLVLTRGIIGSSKRAICLP